MGGNLKHLRLKRFNPKSIKPNPVILIVGKRGSGKTVLVKDIVRHLKNRFDIAVAIAGTSASAEMFQEFIPDALIYNTVQTHVIEKMVDLAKVVKDHNKKREFLLLMDDCMYVKGLMRNGVFREIHMNGRNFGFSEIISAQYVMDMETDLRSQVDYVFVFQENIRANRERLWKYFFGIFDTFEEFSTTLRKCTQNYECLVIDQRVNTGNIEDMLYYYKANVNVPRFTIGRPAYWAMDHAYRSHTLGINDNDNLLRELVRRIDKESDATSKSNAKIDFYVQKVL